MSKSYAFAIHGKCAQLDAWAGAVVVREPLVPFREHRSEAENAALDSAAWDSLVEMAARRAAADCSATLSSMYLEQTRRERNSSEPPSVFFSAHDGKKGWPLLKRKFAEHVERLSGGKVVLETDCAFFQYGHIKAAKELLANAVDFEALSEISSAPAPSARRKI